MISLVSSVLYQVCVRIVIINVNDRPVLLLNGQNMTQVTFTEGGDRVLLADGITVSDEDVEDYITRYR